MGPAFGITLPEHLTHYKVLCVDHNIVAYGPVAVLVAAGLGVWQLSQKLRNACLGGVCGAGLFARGCKEQRR